MSTDKLKDENKGNHGENANDHVTVVIHIVKDQYKSPNPTTGAALYLLGNVDAANLDLFKEIHGKGDDELVPNDTSVVNLKNGDHFFTAQKKLNPGA